MDSNPGGIDSNIIRDMFLKEKEKYLSIINQLFKNKSDDFLSPDLDSDPDDYIVSEKTIDEQIQDLLSTKDSDDFISSEDDYIIELPIISEEDVNDTLEKIYLSNPDLEQDNTVLWNIVWIQCFCNDISDCLYYLQQNGIKDSEWAQAFSSEQDIPFEIIKKAIGSKRIREISGEITKNRLKKIDSAKPRLKIVRLLLHKLYQGESDGSYMLYNEDSEDSFSQSLIDETIRKMDVPAEQKIYELNQWDCGTEDAAKALTDIMTKIRLHGLIALKSMEFPLSPFYSKAVKLLLNLTPLENFEKILKKLADETVKDAEIRMDIIIDWALSFREGAHPMYLLWNLGQKFKQLQKPLNEKYNHPLFESGNSIKEWEQQNLEYQSLRKNNFYKSIIKSFGKKNFWTDPLEEIVIKMLEYSFVARYGGYHSIEEDISSNLFQNEPDIIGNSSLQTQCQKTYTFLFYASQMALNGVESKDIEFCLRYNASKIIEQTRNHLKLAHHTFCRQADKIGEYPYVARSIIPEIVLYEN